MVVLAEVEVHLRFIHRRFSSRWKIHNGRVTLHPRPHRLTPGLWMNSLPVYNNRLQIHHRLWYSPTFTVPTTVKPVVGLTFCSAPTTLGWAAVSHRNSLQDLFLRTSGPTFSPQQVLTKAWPPTMNWLVPSPAMPAPRQHQVQLHKSLCRRRRTRARGLPRRSHSQSVAFCHHNNCRIF